MVPKLSGDLSRLFGVDMKGRPFAAVRDLLDWGNITTKFRSDTANSFDFGAYGFGIVVTYSGVTAAPANICFQSDDGDTASTGF